MYTISLWPGWGVLCVTGEKQFETRSRPWSITGTVAIHHSRRWDGALRHIFSQSPFREALARHGFNIFNMPVGRIVGTVDIISYHRTEAIAHTLTAQERAFGDFTPGRWAIQLANPFVFPIDAMPEASGKLWPWQWEGGEDYVAQLRERAS